MTPKQMLMNALQTYDPENAVLHLHMALPYSNGTLAEIIVVPGLFIFDKLAYIEQMYNEGLEMNHNPAVKILKFKLK